MSKVIRLAISDLRNIIRDDILKYFFLAVPLLFILILVIVIPALMERFPMISSYSQIIVSFFLLEIPLIIGFVISFLMLDEKDERVFTALRTMPISLFQFLFYRLFFSVFFAFLFVFLMLLFNGLYQISLIKIVLNSFAFALITPILILLEVTFASNKVVGFTLFKGLNFIFIIPVAGFLIESKWKILLGVIPTYWPIQGIYKTLNQNSHLLEQIISVCFSLILIIVLSMLFKRKVYHIS